jgi:hypothetical protein
LFRRRSTTDQLWPAAVEVEFRQILADIAMRESPRRTSKEEERAGDVLQVEELVKKK